MEVINKETDSIQAMSDSAFYHMSMNSLDSLLI